MKNVIRQRIWAVIKRCAQWLLRRALQVEATVSIPVPECQHHDPDVQMRKLVAATQEPRRFAAVLAETANCEGCQLALVAAMAYELAGLVMADPEDDSDAGGTVACEHSFNPELVAMRLTLANGDVDATAYAINQARDCPVCLTAIILSITNGHVSVLNSIRGVAWRPLIERQLLARLDAER